MTAGENTDTPALTAATWFRRMRASPGESQIAAQFVNSCAPKHRSGGPAGLLKEPLRRKLQIPALCLVTEPLKKGVWGSFSPALISRNPRPADLPDPGKLLLGHVEHVLPDVPDGACVAHEAY